MTAVEPGSPRWQELVQQGIIRDGQRNWFLGDAALEIAPMGENGAHNGSQDNLRQYADEIGVEHDHLRIYRQVANAWPPAIRISGEASWSVHQILMKPENQGKIQPGLKASDARGLAGVRNTGLTRMTSPPEQKVDLVREYLSDPDVLAGLFEGDDGEQFLASITQGRVPEDPGIECPVGPGNTTAPTSGPCSPPSPRTSPTFPPGTFNRPEPPDTPEAKATDLADAIGRASILLRSALRLTTELEFTDHLRAALNTHIEVHREDLNQLEAAVNGQISDDDIFSFLEEAQ